MGRGCCAVANLNGHSARVGQNDRDVTGVTGALCDDFAGSGRHSDGGVGCDANVNREGVSRVPHELVSPRDVRVNAQAPRQRGVLTPVDDLSGVVMARPVPPLMWSDSEGDKPGVGTAPFRSVEQPRIEYAVEPLPCWSKLDGRLLPAVRNTRRDRELAFVKRCRSRGCCGCSRRGCRLKIGENQEQLHKKLLDFTETLLDC